MQRDSLDFKHMSIGKLFAKQFIPTLMGMIVSALFVVVDGIFVGNGIGSEAIAAVNISAPIFMIITGIGLMFGTGGGVLASINLSREKSKVANINITQSSVALTIVSVIITLIITLFPQSIARLFGANDILMDKVTEYLFWFSISLPFTVMVVALPFFVRLTNPKIAMWAMLIATGFNLILDYLFIFVFHWGLMGAAIATDISEFIGAVIMLVYLFKPSVSVRFVRLKLSIKSMLLTLRNVGYMIRIGFPVCLSELTIAVMMLAGNYTFMRYLGADGVAAYSIICYLFPIIFMVFNATIQSAQPIMSYNYGCGQMERTNKALRLSMIIALVFALFITLVFMFFANNIVSLFVPDKASLPWKFAVEGLPLFAMDYLFFGVNIITIGYYTSIERINRAMILTMLRGVLPVIFFYVLPLLFGIRGVWLAVATGDVIITIIIIVLFLSDKFVNSSRVSK